MAPLDYIAAHIVVWLLVLVRVSGIFVTAPVFGNYQVPPQVRVLMALGLTTTLAPLASPQTAPFPSETLPFVAAILREAMLGLILGFIPALMFLAIQYAAEMIDLQVGFGMGGWIDPTFRTSVSPLSNLQYLLATVIFLALDGHHLILEALANSFRVLPLGTFALAGVAAKGIADLFAQMGLTGVQVAAPILSVLLATDMGLGIVGRAAPQLNLLVVTPPLKALVALTSLAASLPLVVFLMMHLFTGVRLELATFLRAAVGVGYVR